MGGTTGSCHGEAVTSEEPPGEVKEVVQAGLALPGCTGHSKGTHQAAGEEWRTST